MAGPPPNKPESSMRVEKVSKPDIRITMTHAEAKSLLYTLRAVTLYGLTRDLVDELEVLGLD